MQLSLVTAATGDPIGLAEAKQHLFITSTGSTGYNADLTKKISAATEYCQRRIAGHRQFMPATYELELSRFPLDNGRIELPLPPLSEITTVKYYATDGTTSLLSSTGYYSITPTDDPGFIEPAYGQNWPSVRIRPDAVRIRYKAGYADAAGVPETAKQAILLKLEHLWDPARVGEKEMEEAIDRLLGCNEYGHYS